MKKKLFYLGILKNDTKPAFELSREDDLSDWGVFSRPTVREFAILFATEAAETAKPNVMEWDKLAKHIDGLIYSYNLTKEGICAIAITDLDYPKDAASALLNRVCKDFINKHPISAYKDLQPPLKKSAPPLVLPELKEYIVKFQDPDEADPLIKIQREVEETKRVLQRTIESSLERDEKLDNLVAKSNVLSAQSKVFYTQAKKQNSCCVVM
ncbi:synaptobrevin [Byssothecium circinans]|uniref:Synaptobrevin n=1 Tax=Byssothecium circinans TaxID=147558 RepID=A0A6A5TLB9_9PLEO|nr:synaptobrevin [Byssothecium circinans]